MYVRKLIVLTTVVLVVISVALGTQHSAARAATVKSPQHKETLLRQSVIPYSSPKSLSTISKGFKLIIRSGAVIPKNVIDCLSVSIGVTNPTVGGVVIHLSVFNFCANAIPSLFWEYNSAKECGGNADDGPANSGFVNLSAGKGFARTDSWLSTCTIDGIPIGYYVVYDGYADGVIANNGNVGQGSDQQSYNFW